MNRHRVNTKANEYPRFHIKIKSSDTVQRGSCGRGRAGNEKCTTSSSAVSLVCTQQHIVLTFGRHRNDNEEKVRVQTDLKWGGFRQGQHYVWLSPLQSAKSVCSYSLIILMYDFQDIKQFCMKNPQNKTKTTKCIGSLFAFYFSLRRKKK